MSRIKNGFLFVSIAMLAAVSQAQGQIGDLVPPIDTHQQNAISRLKPEPRTGAQFLPLIDDVVDRAYYQPTPDADQPTARTCQLNAPLPFDSDPIDQSTTANHWVIAKGSIPVFLTSEFKIQEECPNCDSCRNEACVDEPCVNAGDSQGIEVLESSARESSMDLYCEQVASILITTLDGSKDNPKGQQRAIQAALKMVAEKSNLIAQAETDELQESHHQSLKHLLMEFARKGQANFVADNKSLLEPIYATQFRNSKQLTKLRDVDQSIMRSLMALDKKITSFAMMQRAKLSGAEVRQMMDALDEENARNEELERMQSELQVLDRRIEQLQSNPVRPATHLEPIYMPTRPLMPLTDPANR